MGFLKKRSQSSLIAGLERFEDSKNAVKKADYGDLKAFVNDFLNTPDKKQRRKLSEEFKKRHLELYQFIKDNEDLICAETEISKTVANVVQGETSETENRELNNLFEAIRESDKL